MSSPTDDGDDVIREQRLRLALQSRADEVTARDLTRTWADVVREAERSTPVDLVDARDERRGRRRLPVAAAAAVAAAVLVVGGLALAGLHRGVGQDATPAGRTVQSTPVSGVAPGEQSRTQIPWDTVGPGWSAAIRADSADAPGTLYLLSPSGTRYAVGQVAAGTTVLDVAPDGRRILTQAAGTGTSSDAAPPAISEWDVGQGTARVIALATDVTSVSTTVRYTKPSGRAILVEYVEAGSRRPVVERRGLDGTLQLRYPAIPGQRIPLSSNASGPPSVDAPELLGTPDGLDFVVPTTSGMALVGNAQGTLVRSYPLPAGRASCSPVSWWSEGILLARCDAITASGTTSDLWTFPVSGAPAERRTSTGTAAAAWPTLAGTLVVSTAEVTGTTGTTGSPCAATRVTVDPATGKVTAVAPSLPQTAPATDEFRPLAVVGTWVTGTWVSGGSCPSAAAGIAAHDLATGATVPLLGAGVDGGVVTSVVTLVPR